MYGKKVKALIWNDETFQSKDIRRTFQPLYIFGDGFETLEAAIKAVLDKDYKEELFRYICFCRQWYPVFLNSFYKGMVITKEYVKYYDEAYGEWETVPYHENVEFKTQCFFAGNKPWQKGIYNDLNIIDENICVYTAKNVPVSGAEEVNSITTFGIPHFATEICIRTNSYTEHVFQHYYSNKSMEYKRKIIIGLRGKGIEYYNPFSKETSKTEKEKNQKNRQLLKGVNLDKTIYDNRRISDINGRRVLTPEDVEAARGRFLIIK